MDQFDKDELKKLIIDVIQEEFSPTPVLIGKRWEGGTLTLKPGNDSQAKDIPIEVFFHKIVGIRDAMRVLEQKINSQDNLSDQDKVNLQSYITKVYGSLTTFNILFKEEKDKFVGAGSKTVTEPKVNLTVSEVRKKIGINEY